MKDRYYFPTTSFSGTMKKAELTGIAIFMLFQKCSNNKLAGFDFFLSWQKKKQKAKEKRMLRLFSGLTHKNTDEL